MAVPLLPEISHYITTNDSAGKSTYLDAPNPPPIYSRCLNYRVDYIYSALGSATGPVLTDRADYKEHQQVSATTPHILFPVEGASAACVVTYAPNPNNEDGFMHRTNTLDYVFIIDGEFELSLDSGEKRIMKKGDVCIQRASMHAWKNLSQTEIARFGAVCLGIEGTKVNEVIIPENEKE